MPITKQKLLLCINKRPSGTGRPPQRRCLQRPPYLGLLEELVLHSGHQQISDALVSGQHIFHGGGRTAEAGQGAEDILQLLALSVADVTQVEFLHRHGGENLVDCVFPLGRQVNVGKGGQREKTISFLNEGACQECAGTTAGNAPY